MRGRGQTHAPLVRNAACLWQDFWRSDTVGLHPHWWKCLDGEGCRASSIARGCVSATAGDSSLSYLHTHGATMPPGIKSLVVEFRFIHFQSGTPQEIDALKTCILNGLKRSCAPGSHGPACLHIEEREVIHGRFCHNDLLCNACH